MKRMEDAVSSVLYVQILYIAIYVYTIKYQMREGDYQSINPISSNQMH